MKIMGGIQDVPREAGEEDLLGIENHIIGMADFIRQTTPPFNISIHGEWGSGKTTFMYRLKEQLKEPSDGNIRQVYFDASDFDSVNQNHSVAYYYINHLLEELNKEAKDRTKQLMDEIKKLSFCLFSAFGTL